MVKDDIIMVWCTCQNRISHNIFWYKKKNRKKKFQRAHRIMARDFTFVITIICKVVRKVFGILVEKKSDPCVMIFFLGGHHQQQQKI